MDNQTNSGAASMLPESENNTDDPVPLPEQARVIIRSFTKTAVI